MDVFNKKPVPLTVQLPYCIVLHHKDVLITTGYFYFSKLYTSTIQKKEYYMNFRKREQKQNKHELNVNTFVNKIWMGDNFI